jgi:hypothetical protein
MVEESCLLRGCHDAERERERKGPGTISTLQRHALHDLFPPIGPHSAMKSSME